MTWRGRPLQSSIRLALLVALGAWAAYQVVLAGLTSSATLGRNVALLERVAPDSPHADLGRAAAALARADYMRAEAHAVDALQRTPLLPSAYSIIALARMERGDAAAGAALMLEAGTLGWRDAATQVWFLRQAVLSSNFPTAVQRADALLRQGVMVDEVTQVLRSSASTPEVARLIAQQLTGRPSWRNRYLTDLRDLQVRDFTGHELVLAALQRVEKEPLRRELHAFVTRMNSEGAHAQARQAWARLARRKVAALADEDFAVLLEDPSGQPVTFEWIPGAGVNIAAARPASGVLSDDEVLELTTRSSADGVVLAQMVVLPPGAYDLSALANEESEGASGGFFWTMRCHGKGRLEQGAATSRPLASVGSWAETTIRFRVPVGCVAQWVELRGGSGPARILLSRVTIEQAST